MKKASKRKSTPARGRKPAAKPATCLQAKPSRAPGLQRAARFVHVMTARRRWPSPAVALAAYGRDDRQALALMMLPIILVAFAVGMGQSLRPSARPIDVANQPRPAAVARPASVPARASTAPVTLETPVTLTSPAPRLPAAAPPIAEPPIELSRPLGPLETRVPDALADALSSHVTLPLVPLALAAAAPELVARPAVAAPDLRIAPGPPLIDTQPGPLSSAPPSVEPPRAVAVAPPKAPENVCVAAPPVSRPRPATLVSAPDTPRDAAAFGAALAAAAYEQTKEFVVYNDKYRRIAYPMGDVSPFYGVCTDVVIRAYRELGIDLQALVHTSRVGSGDRNIDHRRVDTLRKFFAAHGMALPVTDFAEDYRPGDIVSYWRPQNRHSRTHIAIVANEIGPSGRPMIIHNRGWGPQIEDGLFVDQITGHYRFAGPKAPASTAAQLRASPAAAASTVTGAAPAKATSGPSSRTPLQRRREAGVAGERTTR